jgi:Family of unknown function (DUF6132)/Thioredoxin
MGLILSILIGGGLGAALGYFGKCSSGTCPLTANPWRGALYGVVLGLLFHFAAARRSELPAPHSANVRLVNQEQFNAELSQASGPIVVDFFATWCGPCKKLSPMLDELAEPSTNQIKFRRSMWTNPANSLSDLASKEFLQSSFFGTGRNWAGWSVYPHKRHSNSAWTDWLRQALSLRTQTEVPPGLSVTL